MERRRYTESLVTHEMFLTEQKDAIVSGIFGSLQLFR